MKRIPQSPERIGIYGGTFDPPHAGHLIIAEAARVQLGLAKVIFMPAARAPHKTNRKATPPRLRFEMLKRALSGSPAFAASALELKRGGVSYTIDTIRELAKKYPGREFWLIVGSDNMRDLFHWKEPLELLKRCHVAVYRRPGFPVSSVILRRSKAVVLDGGLLDISATVIRRLEGRSGSIRYLVPSAVERFIHRHHLYRPVRRRTRT